MLPLSFVVHVPHGFSRSKHKWLNDGTNARSRIDGVYNDLLEESRDCCKPQLRTRVCEDTSYKHRR